MDELLDANFDQLPQYEKDRIRRKIEMEKEYIEYLKTEEYFPQTPEVERRLGPWLPPPILVAHTAQPKKIRKPRAPRPPRDPNEPRAPPRRSGRHRKFDGSYTGNSGEEEESSESGDIQDYYQPPAKRARVTNFSEYSAPPSVDQVTPAMLARVQQQGTNKVYDNKHGTSCHQCRQKTTDQKTICRSGRCVGVRGQLCTRCLKTRYGEDIEVALLDPAWTCPHCLQECNASICRTRIGLTPTGQIYERIADEYGDVRSYLRQCEGSYGATSGYESTGARGFTPEDPTEATVVDYDDTEYNFEDATEDRFDNLYKVVNQEEVADLNKHEHEYNIKYELNNTREYAADEMDNAQGEYVEQTGASQETDECYVSHEESANESEISHEEAEYGSDSGRDGSLFADCSGSSSKEGNSSDDESLLADIIVNGVEWSYDDQPPGAEQEVSPVVQGDTAIELAAYSVKQEVFPYIEEMSDSEYGLLDGGTDLQCDVDDYEPRVVDRDANAVHGIARGVEYIELLDGPVSAERYEDFKGFNVAPFYYVRYKDE